MSRLIFPFIAMLGLTLVKVGPDGFTHLLRGAGDFVATISKKINIFAKDEFTAEMLIRGAKEIPVREPDAIPLAQLEASPVFRSVPVRPAVSEGQRYAVDRIASEISRIGVQNIREYTEYVEATHVVLTTVPRNVEEFRGVYGRPPSANELVALSSEAEAVAREFVHVSDVASILRSIEEHESNFVTFVGHNVEGVFKLPNGDTIEIGEIARHCASLGKRCIFLSCNSEDYLSATEGSAFGVDRQITFKGAHMIANFLSNRMLKLESMSYMSASDNLREELRILAQAANLSDTISASAPPVIVAGGIGGIHLAVNDDR